MNPHNCGYCEACGRGDYSKCTTFPTTKPGEADLMELIEQYADARHKHGAPEYNAISSAARNRVIAALGTAPATPVPGGEQFYRRVVSYEGFGVTGVVFEPVATPVQPVPASEPVKCGIHYIGGFHSTWGCDVCGYKEVHDAHPGCRRPTSPAPAPATQADAAEVGQWRPIESAPKESKARLVWCQERRNVYVVCWNPTRAEWEHFGGAFRPLYEVPTHWMPLPSAPADSSMGGGER